MHKQGKLVVDHETNVQLYYEGGAHLADVHTGTVYQLVEWFAGLPVHWKYTAEVIRVSKCDIPGCELYHGCGWGIPSSIVENNSNWIKV